MTNDKSTAETYYEKMHKAIEYLHKSHSFFITKMFPSLEKDIETWVMDLPENKKLEALKKRKNQLKVILERSGFLSKYSSEIPRRDIEFVYDAFGVEVKASDVLSSMYFNAALTDLFDGMGVLNVDKLAVYIYDHQEDITPPMVSAFFKYVELTKVLNGFIKPYEEVEDFFANIERIGERLEAVETSKEPKKLPYDEELAMMYLEDKQHEFEVTQLPKEIRRVLRWWERIPKAKQTVKLIEKKSEEYWQKLFDSKFLDHYGFGLSREEIESIIMDENEGLIDSFDQTVAYTEFSHALNHLYEGIDVLNMERLERYVWQHQQFLTNEQLFAFLTYHEMKTFLPSLLDGDCDALTVIKKKTIGEVDVDEKTKLNVLVGTFNDDEQEIDINTIYTESLRTKSVYDAFCNVMRECIVPKVNEKGGSRAKKWCWPHVYDALKDERLGYIGSDASITEFGRAMHELDSTVKAVNVTQRLKVKRKDYPSTTDNNIIADIIKTMQANRTS